MNCSELMAPSTKLRSRCLTSDYALLGYDNSLIRWDLSPYTRLSLRYSMAYSQGKIQIRGQSEELYTFPKSPAREVVPSAAGSWSEDPLYVLTLGACQGDKAFAGRLYARIQGQDPQIALAADTEFQAYLAVGDTAEKSNQYRIALLRYFASLPAGTCSQEELLLAKRKFLEIQPAAHEEAAALGRVSASTQNPFEFVGPLLAGSLSSDSPYGSSRASPIDLPVSVTSSVGIIDSRSRVSAIQPLATASSSISFPEAHLLRSSAGILPSASDQSSGTMSSTQLLGDLSLAEVSQSQVLH